MLSEIDIYIYTYNESHMTQPTIEVIINHCPSAKMDHWYLLGTNTSIYNSSMILQVWVSLPCTPSLHQNSWDL